MTVIHINSFVRRQTPDSEFSCFGGDDAALLALTHAGFANATPGYREGVLVVPVDPERFRSAVVTLQEGDKLSGEFKARRKGETPRKHTGLDVPKDERFARKIPAAKVDVILYASTTLAEGKDNELDAVEGNWEIISLNAFTSTEDAPIAPMTLLHNHFGSDGGSATGMTADELIEAMRVSMDFWRDKTLLA